MANFIRVAGKLPGEKSKGLKATGFLYLHRYAIKAIYPFWGVSKDGKLFESTRTLQGAEAHFLWVVDLQDNRYRLMPSDWEELLDKKQIEMMVGKKHEEEEQLVLIMPTPDKSDET